MEGFGVHTFRCVNAAGETSLVKFHWKPVLGVHSLTWEAQMLAGMDPDFHRRDLYDAIEAGAYPQWELGVQVVPDTPDETFDGIDLLDPTKIIPEELAPVQAIGLLTPTGNPTNFFAETEQVAFHVGNLVPGIDVTNDPLLQARLFSYIDTQLTRLGGPNFHQLPINRPHAPVNDMLRDGFHQSAVHGGGAVPAELARRGCPFHAGAKDGAFVEVAARVAGRRRPGRSPPPSTTTTARRVSSGSACRRRRRSTSCSPTRSSSPSASSRRSRSASSGRWPTSTRSCAARLPRASASRSRPDRGPRRPRESGVVTGRRDLALAGSSASSWTRPATWRGSRRWPPR